MSAREDRQFFDERIRAVIAADRRSGPSNPEQHRFSDFISAVVQVDNADDARRFYNGYIVSNQSQVLNRPPKHRHRATTPEEDARGMVFLGMDEGKGLIPDDAWQQRLAMWQGVLGATPPPSDRTVSGDSR